MVKLKLISCVAMALAALGCATSGTGALDDKGKLIEPVAAQFSLSSATVLWDAENYLVAPKMNCSLAPAGGVYCPKDEKTVNRAKSRTAKMLSLLKEHLPSHLSEKLQKLNVAKGGNQTVLIEPLSSYWNEAGWGSGIRVKITVQDEMSKQKWTHVMNADTGIQWLGAAGASEPDIRFVEKFSSDVVFVFKKAHLVTD